MRIKICLLFLLLAGIASAKMPRNSFLKTCAHTTQELVLEVKNDREVGNHYERFFQMTHKEVVNYFKTLHLGTIQKTEVYYIYGVPANGMIHSHLRVLHAGEQAWFDPDGKAILYYICGNPISKSGFDRAVPIAANLSGGAMPSTPPTAEASPSIISTVDVALTPDAPTAPTEVITVATPPPSTIPIMAEEVPSSNNFFPAALLSAGALFATGGHSGGTLVTPPQAVPEPSSLLAIAIPITGLICIRRRR